jgi:hypothetical protein
LHFAEQLTACGFGVYAMDWIGKEPYFWVSEHVYFYYVNGNIKYCWFGGSPVLYLETKSECTNQFIGLLVDLTQLFPEALKKKSVNL